MGATLAALHRLQSIETQLRTLRDQISSKRRSVQAHQRRLADLESKITRTQTEIRQAQADADRLELQRKNHEQHIAKLRETLNQAKTNKEYAAVLTELNTDKADVVKLEDSVLKGLQHVDDLKAKEAQDRAKLDKEKSRLAELERSAKDLETGLESQLQHLEQQREQAADDIPPEALRSFERACEAHDGEALAEVQQPHPRRTEFICGGCYMSITLETVNSLQSRDDVRICQNCSRILYLEAPSGVSAS